jgi:hypothetical protein
MTTESSADSNVSGLPPLEPDHPLLDALREALGEILAEQQPLIEAQAAAVVADMRAEIVTLNGKFERVITGRLSSLRDGEPARQDPKASRGLRAATAACAQSRNGPAASTTRAIWFTTAAVCINASRTPVARRRTKIGCASCALAVTPARRGFAARGPRMANTVRLMSVPWAGARSSRPRTVPVFVQGMDGRLSRCPASAGSKDLLGRVGRRARRGRRVSRRR